MISFYRWLSILATPFLYLYFYVRCYLGKDEWDSVKNHFGINSAERRVGRYIWIHAVSIGESTSALTYIKHLSKTHPEINVLLTTMTVTSANILKDKLKNFPNCTHQFVVADNPLWIKKFLDYWNVETAIFLESEIWPNILQELHNRNIPIYLLNARLSEKSFNRWGLFKKSFSRLLNLLTKILAQSDLDKARFDFFQMGNVVRIDNLKYANDPLPGNDDLLKRLKKLYKGKKVFVAASTHAGEEEILLDAYQELKKKFDLVLVIVPRHLDRVCEIVNLIHRNGENCTLRSEISGASADNILCVDSFGEVGTFFRFADVTFVGGSLVPIGGHNIYEPVVLGKPVLFGPHMENALEVADMLTRKSVAFEVKNCSDIVKHCAEFFSDQHLLEKIKKLSAATSNKALAQIDEIIHL